MNATWCCWFLTAQNLKERDVQFFLCKQEGAVCLSHSKTKAFPRRPVLAFLCAGDSWKVYKFTIHQRRLCEERKRWRRAACIWRRGAVSIWRGGVLSSPPHPPLLSLLPPFLEVSHLHYDKKSASLSAALSVCINNKKKKPKTGGLCWNSVGHMFHKPPHCHITHTFPRHSPARDLSGRAESLRLKIDSHLLPQHGSSSAR